MTQRKTYMTLQLMPLAAAMLVAALWATGSQGGGITPFVAFFCPLFGPLSVLFEPNSRPVSELPAWVLLIALGTATAGVWLAALAHKGPEQGASKNGRRVSALIGSIAAISVWALMGLMRVGYSMM